MVVNNSETWLFICDYTPDIISRALYTPDFDISSWVRPLIKKSGLDPDILKNYRPVSNLPFISKVLEKVEEHIVKHNLHEVYQSAYRKHHSTETA